MFNFCMHYLKCRFFGVVVVRFFIEKSSHVAMRSDLRLHASHSGINKNINLGLQSGLGTRVTPIVSGLGFALWAIFLCPILNQVVLYS